MIEKHSCGQQTERISKIIHPDLNLYGTGSFETSDEILIKPVALKSIDTSHYESATKVARYHCNCKYLWLRELHGLSAFMMSNSLKEKIFWLVVMISCGAYSVYNTTNILHDYGQEASTTLITILPTKKLKFPTLVFCPRNPDFINYYNVLEDLYGKLGYMENTTNFDILRYAMTGFGLDNANTEFLNETYRATLNEFYLQWRGNRSQLEMFDFMYNKNGYTCQDMFQTCYGGSITYNCCDIFESTYAMLRGRCFRLIDSYYQNDTDETAKLMIYFNNMTSPILSNGTAPQLVLYNADSNYEVGIFPRFYLNSNDWNRIRYTQKSLQLLPTNDRCSTEKIYQGKFTCFVYKWLMQLVNQFNCTVPYYKNKLHYLTDVPVCEAKVMVDNFHNISLTPTTQGYKCTPACSRIENTVQLTTSIDFDPDPTYMFRLEASFTYLEYEQYKEVRTTSIAGFISELGGQAGLFVGSSIMTLVQLINSIVNQIYKRTCKCLDKKAFRVRLGLFTTHHTEPADKHYPRPIHIVNSTHPFLLEHLSTIPEEKEDDVDETAPNEVGEHMNADGLLLEDGEISINCSEDLESIGLSVSMDYTQTEDDDSILYDSIDDGNDETVKTFATTSGSEPHDTVSEQPEDVRIARLIWIRERGLSQFNNMKD